MEEDFEECVLKIVNFDIRSFNEKKYICLLNIGVLLRSISSV
jgi:hypothetical protein